MADENICDNCGFVASTGRGLNIHIARTHPSNSVENPMSGADLDAAKTKLMGIIARARPAAFINILLSGPAATYGDPDIKLSDQEMSDLNGVIQEVMAEIGPSYTKDIAKYLPWLAVIMIALPILADKIGRIVEARARGPPNPPPEPRDSGEKSAPPKGATLTRADIMPDFAGTE